MPPRRRRRAPPTKPQPEEPPGADAPLEERLAWESHQESERQITAIKAIKEAEAGDMCSRFQLVRSYLSKEQLEANALEYFQENLPNLSVVPNEKYDVLELKWNGGDRCIIGDFVDDKNLQASIASLPNAGGLQCPGISVYVAMKACSEQLPEGQRAGADAFQTPGVVSNQLSFGMTPKTVRGANSFYVQKMDWERTLTLMIQGAVFIQLKWCIKCVGNVLVGISVQPGCQQKSVE
ncbi:uncharacterized protein C2845_PM08G15960 [Panicum miliaceum]|uniref:Uncharacterized protein n=1 Tax=Panicum miliaceum TaxID=4540 RepID=A0A3L6R0E9_PANMI|nr:uncharacterized protein C2845_PM08G15960 [Panicum miliaceum]